MALTNCPECKAAVAGGAAKCRTCGFPLPSSCPECGQGIANQATACWSCGFPFASLVTPMPAERHPGNASRAKWAVGIALLAVAGAGWFGWTFFAGRTQPPTPTPVSEAARTVIADAPVGVPAGSSAGTNQPEPTELARGAGRLRGAPYFFDNVSGYFDDRQQPAYVIVLRSRKTLDQCANQTIVRAAQHARGLLGGKDGATHAEQAYQPILALTRSEPNCFAGWEWLAEVSFLRGRKADFQKAVGQMVNLGLHQCVKNETWVMLQKAVGRGWLEPFVLAIRRNDAEIATGHVEVGSTTNAAEPDIMVAEDGTRGQADGSTHFTVIAKREQLYVGAGKDLLPQGFGVLQNADGTVYRGEFANGLYEGRGILTSPDGSTYSGTFRGGAWAGPGLANIKDVGMIEEHRDPADTVLRIGSMVFKGSLAGGVLKHGVVFDTESKLSWQGEFVSGKLNGYGLRTFPDGSQLEGLFVNGAPTWQTTFKNKAGTKYYWVEDEDNTRYYWSESDPDHYVTLPFAK